MKEYTVTMNAQLTFIYKGSEYSEETFRIETEEALAEVFKMYLAADDVVVSDLKLFVLDKEGESHETDK